MGTEGPWECGPRMQPGMWVEGHGQACVRARGHLLKALLWLEVASACAMVLGTLQQADSPP